MGRRIEGVVETEKRRGGEKEEERRRRGGGGGGGGGGRERPAMNSWRERREGNGERRG